MGRYQIEISDIAQKDFEDIKKSGRKSDIAKVEVLVKELVEHPREGTGKPEQLKYQEREIWSRRINQKDRLVYEIIDDKIVVFILQAKGHYDDK